MAANLDLTYTVGLSPGAGHRGKNWAQLRFLREEMLSALVDEMIFAPILSFFARAPGSDLTLWLQLGSA